MIDTSPDSIRILSIMILGVIWFALLVDNFTNGDESYWQFTMNVRS